MDVRALLGVEGAALAVGVAVYACTAAVGLAVAYAVDRLRPARRKPTRAVVLEKRRAWPLVALAACTGTAFGALYAALHADAWGDWRVWGTAAAITLGVAVSLFAALPGGITTGLAESSPTLVAGARASLGVALAAGFVAAACTAALQLHASGRIREYAGTLTTALGGVRTNTVGGGGSGGSAPGGGAAFRRRMMDADFSSAALM